MDRTRSSPRQPSRTTSKFAIGQGTSSWVRRWRQVQRDQDDCQKAADKIYQSLRFHKAPLSDCIRTRLEWVSGGGAPLKWNPKLCTCSICRAAEDLPMIRGDLSLNCHNRLRDRHEKSSRELVRLGTLVGRGLVERPPPVVRDMSKPYVIVALPWLVHSARDEPTRERLSNTMPMFLPQVVGAKIECRGKD